MTPRPRRAGSTGGRGSEICSTRDRSGSYFYVDRAKDALRRRGENISSVEVEGILLRHPAVQEVAVVGVPHEKWGEAPRAFVVLKSGGAATEDELREFARERMAHFKVPHGFAFVPELPKTATGKIQKYVLRGKTAAIHKQ